MVQPANGGATVAASGGLQDRKTFKVGATVPHTSTTMLKSQLFWNLGWVVAHRTHPLAPPMQPSIIFTILHGRHKTYKEAPTDLSFYSPLYCLIYQ
jgi:hypothetical protein